MECKAPPHGLVSIVGIPVSMQDLMTLPHFTNASQRCGYIPRLDALAAAPLRRMVSNLLNGKALYDGVEITYEPASRFAPAALDRYPVWISSGRTAKMIGWSTETLRRYRKMGKGPEGYQRTGVTSGVYPLHCVVKFIEERRRGR